MLTDLRELWRFRGLLWQLVRRDLKVRYKNSRLGFLWSVAPPLMQVAVITFAFKRATDFAANMPNYSAYLLAAMIPWTYFQSAILDSSQSILVMYGVIKKVYLPREIIPLSNTISNFIHFLLSWLVFFVYWWAVRPFMDSQPAPVLATTLWFPYLIVVQFMLVAGISLFVSALNVFYEDVKYVVNIVMGLFLFLLPVMYLVDTVYYRGNIRHLWHGWGFRLYRLNPLTALIDGYRRALLEPPPPKAIGGPPLPLDVHGLLITGLVSLLVLVAGYAYFNSRKWQFTERP